MWTSKIASWTMDALSSFDLAQFPNFKIKLCPPMLNLRVGNEEVDLFSCPSRVRGRARQPTMVWFVDCPHQALVELRQSQRTACYLP
jgi:hypothetical protein